MCHLDFLFILFYCTKPALCCSWCENHKSWTIIRCWGGKHDSVRWYRLPNVSTLSLPPLTQLLIPHTAPSYHHLSLAHSSPVTGCYGNCNQEVHSLHHEWFVLEDERFVERRCDGVMFCSRLQHQTQVARHFVLLQSFHLPFAWQQKA